MRPLQNCFVGHGTVLYLLSQSILLEHLIFLTPLPSPPSPSVTHWKTLCRYCHLSPHTMSVFPCPLSGWPPPLPGSKGKYRAPGKISWLNILIFDNTIRGWRKRSDLQMWSLSLQGSTSQIPYWWKLNGGCWIIRRPVLRSIRKHPISVTA